VRVAETAGRSASAPPGARRGDHQPEADLRSRVLPFMDEALADEGSVHVIGSRSG
jgi:hypothetical protein